VGGSSNPYAGVAPESVVENTSTPPPVAGTSRSARSARSATSATARTSSAKIDTNTTTEKENMTDDECRV